jgi:ferredoxin
MLRKIRLSLAILVIACVTLLFLDFTGTLHHWLGWMAKIQFLPAVLALNVAVIVALVVLTLVFGRIYCSVICPLGIFQDFVSWIHGRRKKNRFNYSREMVWLRYPVLVVFILAMIFGVGSFVALLAPYSAYGRIVSNLFQPVYEWINNAFAAIAEHYDSYAFYSTDVWLKSVPTFIIAVVTFVVLCILAWKNGRTYCNTICPVGTVLSFFARFSWFKIRINEDKCIKCGLCGRNCKASCIDSKGGKIDYSRCVVCGDCIGKCSSSALSYCHSVKKANAAKESEAQPVDKGTRAFLFAAAAVTTSAVFAQQKKKLDGGLAAIEEKKVPKRETPLTPPGSLSARNMAQHCTGCQLCVSECPNGVLRPSSDLLKLMQPTMSYERGYCRPECTRCSQVCPAGAIKPITIEEKSSTQIGHAVWIKENCIVVKDGVACGNCQRHCPAGAIRMLPLDDSDDAPLVPTVNEEACIGCGACENSCPARPFSAIYVEGHEVHRTI